jgi:hypothetical protein
MVSIAFLEYVEKERKATIRVRTCRRNRRSMRLSREQTGESVL